MKFLFSLFCCCLLISSYSTSLSKDTLLINNFSVNGLKLGMSINNVKKQLLLSDSVVLYTNDPGYLYHVYYQDKIIMSYNSKNNSSITMIEVFSPIFHTKNGIRVGDNIRKIIGDTLDNINENENIEQDSDTGYYFYFEEEGKFDMWFVFDEEGKILWIGLYCLQCK